MNTSCKACEASDQQPPSKLGHGGPATLADDSTASAIESKSELKQVQTVKRNGCNHRREFGTVADNEVRIVHPQHAIRTSDTLDYSTEPFGLLPAYLKDMFLAAHFLRGNRSSDFGPVTGGLTLRVGVFIQSVEHVFLYHGLIETKNHNIYWHNLLYGQEKG